MNKTIIIFSFVTLLFAGRLSAQAPSQINYQAALRNTETGVELSNQQVFMVVKFLNGGPDGDIVYQEEHSNVTTSLYGIINIQLGNGNPIQGNFSAIPWNTGDIWLDLEVDAGKGLQSIGTTKFSSVPYALYAADAPQAEPDGDGDPTNEIQDLIFLDNILTISNNDSATPIDLSDFVNTPDDDSDPTNEIQALTLIDNMLSISRNPDAIDIDLTPYVNVPDADSDPTNELITAFTYNPVSAIISLTEAGNIFTLNLSSLAGGGEPDGDSDPTNEIQDLDLTGTTLSITGNPSATPIELIDYKNIPNLDNDSTNEIQDLILSGNTLKISGNSSATDINLGAYQQDLELAAHKLKITGNPSATEVNLTPYINVPNLDNDPTNEIQDLSFTGGKLKITGKSSPNEIDLNGFTNVPNLDNDPTNEIQDLILTGNMLKISDNPSAAEINLGTYTQDLELTAAHKLKITGNLSPTEINLIPYLNIPNLDNDPTNEIQDLSFTGGKLKITGKSSPNEIDLNGFTNVPNLDNDPTNEIQDLILTGNILKISDNPSAAEINLGTYTQDLELTAEHKLKITGNPSATEINLIPYLNIPNLDNDATNEIQDLSISNHILKITGNSSPTNINLSQYQNQALPQGQIFVGNSASVATPQAVTGDLSMTDAGDIIVVGLRTIPISDVAPTNGQKLAYHSGSNMWVPVSDAGTGTKFYAVDPMDFVELHNPDAGSNLNKHNGLKFFNRNAPFAMLRNESIRTIGAPVHLPHGAQISGVKFYVKKTGSGTMKYSLERKQLTNFSYANTTLAGGQTSSTDNNAVKTFTVSPSNGEVNNELYTYRVFVTFSKVFEEDDEDDPSDVEQAVYGIVITYTD